MTVELLKRMLDACYQAKRTRDLLPQLPDGVTSSYIHYLDVIVGLAQQGVQAKVSDISDALAIPRPGVTRIVKEMEAKGYLQKHTSAQDGRITFLSATEKGMALHRTYNEEYFRQLLPDMAAVSDEDAETMIRTIGQFYQIMNERRTHHGNCKE